MDAASQAGVTVRVACTAHVIETTTQSGQLARTVHVACLAQPRCDTDATRCDDPRVLVKIARASAGMFSAAALMFHFMRRDGAPIAVNLPMMEP